MLSLSTSRSTCSVSCFSIHTKATYSCIWILTALHMNRIYQCSLYASTSKWVRVWGITTTSRIPIDSALALAAACCVAQWVPANMYSVQLCGFSRMQGNQLCPSKYLVKCGPNTGSGTSYPQPSLAVSVQHVFQEERIIDYSQEFTSKASALKELHQQ
jgi:hypothetical protein